MLVELAADQQSQVCFIVASAALHTYFCIDNI